MQEYTMTMREIFFESHSTSVDNENGIASGHFDPALSEKGRNQAIELGKRYCTSMPDIILCSDLQRSYMTAEYAFPMTNILKLREPRLREWDYGKYNGKRVEEVELLKSNYLDVAFPKGESLVQAVDRILKCLDECLEKFPGKKLLIIGHRVIYYALEWRYQARSLSTIIATSWKWQPGWRYLH